MRSMTGFGRGECIRHDRKFQIEIKSVNHRYCDFSIKLSRFLNPFEDKIRHRLAEEIIRGKVDVRIFFETFTSRDISVRVNDVYADAYLQALRGLSTRFGMGEPSLEMLASNSEVLIADRYENLQNSDVQAQLWEGLSCALELALSQYNKMRETEGAALARDIEEKYNDARVLVSEIRERVPRAMEEYAAKLRERVDALLDKLGGRADDGRILTEIAILADKSDINEETTRLESHFEQLASMLREKTAVGRRMDFLMQELNREANTIGAKSSDITLTKSVVELKSLIEKIREQIQNIE